MEKYLEKKKMAKTDLSDLYHAQSVDGNGYRMQQTADSFIERQDLSLLCESGEDRTGGRRV